MNLYTAGKKKNEYSQATSQASACGNGEQVLIDFFGHIFVVLGGNGNE